MARSLTELREATMRCRECPIGEHATQSVVGEGPRRARLMLVGEQPGDQEDRQGHAAVAFEAFVNDLRIAGEGYSK